MKPEWKMIPGIARKVRRQGGALLAGCVRHTGALCVHAVPHSIALPPAQVCSWVLQVSKAGQHCSRVRWPQALKPITHLHRCAPGYCRSARLASIAAECAGPRPSNPRILRMSAARCTSGSFPLPAVLSAASKPWRGLHTCMTSNQSAGCKRQHTNLLRAVNSPECARTTSMPT
eukprot:1146871-Pelagomonas_calceolata.AAC.4